MFELLNQYLAAVTWWQMCAALGIFLVTLVGSFAVVAFVLVKLPPTYFHSSHERAFLPDKSRVIRWGGLALKNLAGALLIFFGILMSLPGIPGPGVLTILLGLMLMDFPGKRELESKIISQPRVQKSINSLREKFGRPPLLLD